MAGSRKAYERLGAKVLSLPDVVAQSVGFMGPVFSSAFVIPLVIGVASASGRGGGIATPPPFPDALITPTTSGITNAEENTGPMNPTDWAITSGKERTFAPRRS